MPHLGPRHPRTSWLLAAGLGLAALTFEGHTLRADTSAVVARVGARTITAAELTRRLDAVPAFQLRTFGKTADEIRKNFLEKVLVREALFAAGAEARGLAEREDVRERARAVRRNAMLAKIREEVKAKEQPTPEDIKAYYEKNASKYHAPARIGMAQIIVDKREDALAIIAEAKKDPTPKRWNDLAREKSLDKVTSMQGGNLGYVMPDGTTSEPGVKAAPEVVKAAGSVKDGEVVPEPVKVGEQWAVVMRRQGMKAVDRPLELEAGSIRQLLLHERTEAKIKQIVADLRKQSLTEHRTELVDLLDVTGTGELAPARRPGAMPTARRPAANPVPSPGTLR